MSGNLRVKKQPNDTCIDVLVLGSSRKFKVSSESQKQLLGEYGYGAPNKGTMALLGTHRVKCGEQK